MMPIDLHAHPYPYPSEENTFLVEHVTLLRESLRKLTGRDLVERGISMEEAAAQIFRAPFVVLSHSDSSDPLLTYGNLAGLQLFEMTWDEMVTTPSRYTAEATERKERTRLLEKVAADGFIDDYAGIRISKNGRKFQIEKATVWNLTDDREVYRGQAAMFESWTFL